MQPLIRDYVDFWILHILLENWAYLGFMGGSRQFMVEQFRFAPPNYEPREIVVRLLRLFDAGVLIAETADETPVVVTRDVILDSIRQIRGGATLDGEESWQFWDRPDLVTFGLSDFGGQVWEDLAKPDWDRFVSTWQDYSKVDSEAGQGPIGYYYQTRSRGLIEVYLAPLENEGKLFTRGSSRTTVLRPWEATYWKAFPEGFEFYCESPENFANRDPFGDYFELLCPWYTVPEHLRNYLQ